MCETHDQTNLLLRSTGATPQRECRRGCAAPVQAVALMWKILMDKKMLYLGKVRLGSDG